MTPSPVLSVTSLLFHLDAPFWRVCKDFVKHELWLTKNVTMIVAKLQANSGV